MQLAKTIGKEQAYCFKLWPYTSLTLLFTSYRLRHRQNHRQKNRHH